MNVCIFIIYVPMGWFISFFLTPSQIATDSFTSYLLDILLYFFSSCFHQKHLILCLIEFIICDFSMKSFVISLLITKSAITFGNNNFFFLQKLILQIVYLKVLNHNK